MLSFSEQLRHFITERNIKIYSLSAQSGIDRTLIQKMLKGERLPSDESMVLELASSLLLSPTETDRFIQSYYIAKIGERVYSQRKFIKNFLDSFNTLTAQEDFSIQTAYRHKISKLPDFATVTGKLAINNLVKVIIEMAAMKKNSTIKIIAQPEYSFLFQYLSLVGMNNHNLSVDHILCLENSTTNHTTDHENLYNLKCLDAIIPIIAAGLNYRPRCYYDNVSSHFSNASMMPYMILTDDYGINISGDLTCATIGTSSSHLEMCRHLFDNAAEKSMPMIKTLNSQIENLDFFTDAISSFGHINFQFANEPNLMCFVTKEMLLKYINNSIPDKDRIINSTMQYIEHINESIKSKALKSVFFSEQGLDNFLESGRLDNLPAKYFSSIDPADRYKLLKCMYDASINGTFYPFLVNTLALKTSENLSLVIYKNCALSFLYKAPNQKYFTSIFTEKSIVHAFQDFFEYLSGSNLVFSREKTLSIIKKKLMKHPKNNLVLNFKN
jgi:hypothetical protein